ncbi:hypothetical protein A1O3_07885 [Capronia epimyces CBS 606.96]|uniref:SET domain-containing protein n=1 Tax=Capronia epimyces CBS 606.96 TaxID=1182542 RepID=W9XRI7_9EURO|nr:uncharacterized protein A1O3_07885 [Capronia epimyces CBS 606.96]EXJ79606.1 hypothetical protein A1O3_07885 [Capronia epimyces CBS 606.96]
MAESFQHAGHSDFDQTSAQFIKWFTEADGTRWSSKVQLQDLRNENAGRGAVATAEIAEDEELFAVPRSLVLTTTTSNVPPTAIQPLEETGTWPPLIVTIIYEYLKKDDSPWHAYFKVLPTTFDTLMFWNSAELAELQASAVVQKIGRQQAEESWRETIIPVMLAHPDQFPVPGATPVERTVELIKLAHMAGSLIMAYAFDIDRDDTRTNNDDNDDNDDDNSSGDNFEEDDEDEPFKGMVPFADMLNADADRNNARLFQESDYLIMRATRPISTGEQIFNDYGPLPRSDLLRMYGYITDNYSQYDVVEISHDLLVDVAGKKHNQENKAWLKREEQLDELGLVDDGYVVHRPEPNAQRLDDVLPGQLHMLLRALCTHDNDARAIKKPKDAITIEEAALLQAVLTKRLTEYSTSYEADQAICEALQSDSPSTVVPLSCHHRRYLMAVQVRMGEKEILRQWITLCQFHIKQKSEEMASGSSKRKYDATTGFQSKQAAKKEKHR